MSKSYTVDDDFNGSRLDKWFKNKIINLPHSLFEKILRQNKVKPLLEQIIPGLVVERKSRRYYPQENIASQTVGFTDVDDKGLTGIEKEFNSYLAGTAGWVVKQVDGKGRSQIKTSFPIKPPIDGSNIQLTIDLEYQSILHEELNRRINETNAKGAIGIIINPQNGSILAMSSMPDFNLEGGTKF